MFPEFVRQYVCRLLDLFACLRVKSFECTRKGEKKITNAPNVRSIRHEEP